MPDKKPAGIILVTHTNYGHALLEAAGFIMGSQEGCAAIGVDASQDVEETVAEIRRRLKELDSGNGVLILTDMFGGTPTNLSLSLLSSGKVEVITGVNMPMLLKVLGNRTLPLRELAAAAKKAGLQGIVVAGEVLSQKVADN
ncbi:PTS sugar transporter subunit IIA [Desulfohalovibrio reitneri]|uniref:PTS sugar transporter subunit IIA n=1 Tax=Desulfohalovibrio reitneri TaxID=1307759 RepID=UPI0004A6EA73|nr:PTS sugar transporter subunit IIA [Desulfohalovibrio reitneri]